VVACARAGKGAAIADGEIVRDSGTRVRAAIGLVSCAVLAAALGWVDHQAADALPAGGALSGAVLGATRYSVVLTPGRTSATAAGESIAARIEGRGRMFRGNRIPSGVYRLSLVLDPDGAAPRIAIPVVLPDGVEDQRSSPTLESDVQRSLDHYSLAMVADDPDRRIAFFTDDYRGSSGQDRARKLQEIRSEISEMLVKDFDLRILDARGTGDRVLALLSFATSGQLRSGGDVNRTTGTMVSSLRRSADGWQFARTDVVTLPRFDGVAALPLELATAADTTSIAIVAGRTTSLAKPIVVSPPA
jgi:hypothetical protein